MSVCKYSNKYLPLVEHWAATKSPEEFKQLVESHFTNPKEVPGVFDKAPVSLFGTTPVENIGKQGQDPGMSEDQIAESIHRLSNFVGNRRVVTKMERDFKKRLLGCSIVSLDGGKLSFVKADAAQMNGADALNDNILSYKLELANKVRTFLGLDNIVTLFDEDGKYLSDAEITRVIRDTIKEGVKNEALLSNADVSGSMDARVAYVLLSNFDTFVNKFLPFIKSKTNSTQEGVEKYVYTGPNVKHFSNFSSSEYAKAEDQASDIVRLILDIIPEIDAQGNIIEGSSVGMSGFNAAMMSLKDMALYTDELSADAVATIQMGVDNIALGPKKYKNKYGRPITVNLIDEYLAAAEKDKASHKDVNYFFNRKKFLETKMRGLQHFVFNGNEGTEEEQFIRRCLINMFYKTESVAYRAYGYSQMDGDYRGQNLTNYVLNAQKFQLQDSITSALYTLKNSKMQAADLREKYDIKIKDSKMTLKVGDNVTLTLSYAYTDNDGYVVTDIQSDGNIYDDDYRNVIQDFLCYVVPDTYSQIKTSTANTDWFEDFAPFVLLAGIQAKNLHVPTNWASKSNQRVQLLTAAEKLMIINGGDTKNVVRNLSGGKLPINQLTALAFRAKYVIHDAKNQPNSLMKDCLFARANILGKPMVRNEVVFNGEQKKVTDLNVAELSVISALDDFWFAMNHGSTIYLQNATFSDKSTHFLQAYQLDTALNLTPEVQAVLMAKGMTNVSESTTLRELINESRKGHPEFMLELARVQRNNWIQGFTKRIIADYNIAFNGAVRAAGVKSLTDLDNWLVQNGYTLDQVREAFRNHPEGPIPFEEQLHGVSYKGGIMAEGVKKGQCRMNETLLHKSTIYSSPEKFDAYVKKCLTKYINDIKDNHPYMFKYQDPRCQGLMNALDSTHKNADGKTQLDHFYDTNSQRLNFVSDEGELHPAFMSFFATDFLLSHEYNTLMIGDVAAHANKNTDGVDFEQFAEFSEANRLVAQIKRSVIFGATMHSFAQGLEDGVAEEINIAVINDMEGTVSTPNGVTGTVDSMDGSGQCCSLQSRAENASLLDARVGHNKKTILHSIDHSTGAPVLLKWAVYELTNFVRRSGERSAANAEENTRKMYSRQNIPTDINIDIQSMYDEYAAKNGDIVYYDYDQDQYIRIKSIQNLDQNTYQRTLEVVTSDGNFIKTLEEPAKEVQTLYDIEQLFGGAWAGKIKLNSNKAYQFDYDEGNVDMLADIVNYYKLKDCYTAYFVNSSAIKVGACNVNSSEYWTDSSLMPATFKMSTRYGGIQGDYDHELEEAEVTEMTQMISALIENGYYTDQVVKIYQEIGKIVEFKIGDLTNAVNTNDRNKIYEILGEALIKSFETGTKDTLGIAQIFVQKARTSLDNYKKTHQDFKFEIPFSAATISPAFISSVASDINKSAIRHKYEGYAGVLNPSHNMMMYYRTYNDKGMEQTMLFPEFAKQCKQRIEAALNGAQKVDGKYVDIACNEMYIDAEQTILNPFWKAIDRNDIDFEDTIMAIDSMGNIEQYYVENQEQYENLKYDPRFESYIFYNNTAAAKNLRSYDVLFEVGGKTFHIYDLDSVRASKYAMHCMKAIGDGKTPNLHQVNLEVMSRIVAKDLAKRARNKYDEQVNESTAIFPANTTWIMNDGTAIDISGKSIEQVYKHLLLGNNRNPYSWDDKYLGIEHAKSGSDLFLASTNRQEIRDHNYWYGQYRLWQL